MQTIYMDGQCTKKLPVNGFEWENDLSRFNERFIKKITMKIAIYNIFLN